MIYSKLSVAPERYFTEEFPPPTRVPPSLESPLLPLSTSQDSLTLSRFRRHLEHCNFVPSSFLSLFLFVDSLCSRFVLLSALFALLVCNSPFLALFSLPSISRSFRTFRDEAANREGD